MRQNRRFCKREQIAIKIVSLIKSVFGLIIYIKQLCYQLLLENEISRT